MALQRVLLVCKHIPIATTHHNAVLANDLRQHGQALAEIISALTARGIAFEQVSRHVPGQISGPFDMACSIGGDGTFLYACQFAYSASIPLLGVKSTPSSLAHYCVSNASLFAEHLDQIATSQLAVHELGTLQVKLNGKLLRITAINDILVHHNSPAGTSRYEIRFKRMRERQRSSGVWISTATGSTAAIRAAGGLVLPATADKFQFLVREPGMRLGENWQLLKGVLTRGEELTMLSLMEGKLYLDGHFFEIDFQRDSTVTIGMGPAIRAYIDPACNDPYLEV